MKRLTTWLRKIWSQPDKKTHILAGALVAALTVYVWPTNTWPSISWAFPILAVMVAGILKELYDSTGRGTVDVNDFWATILGGTVVWMAVIIKTFL